MTPLPRPRRSRSRHAPLQRPRHRHSWPDTATATLRLQAWIPLGSRVPLCLIRRSAIVLVASLASVRSGARSRRRGPVLANKGTARRPAVRRTWSGLAPRFWRFGGCAGIIRPEPTRLTLAVGRRFQIEIGHEQSGQLDFPARARRSRSTSSRAKPQSEPIASRIAGQVPSAGGRLPQCRRRGYGGAASAAYAGREGSAALPVADGRLHVWWFVEAKGVVWPHARYSYASARSRRRGALIGAARPSIEGSGQCLFVHPEIEIGD